MSIPGQWYTLNEAAAYMGVSRRTIYKWTKEGRLRTYILGKERTRRFRKEDLDRVPKQLGYAGAKKAPQALNALSASGDPVLAELWNNENDAAYDTL